MTPGKSWVLLQDKTTHTSEDDCMTVGIDCGNQEDRTDKESKVLHEKWQWESCPKSAAHKQQAKGKEMKPATIPTITTTHVSSLCVPAVL